MTLKRLLGRLGNVLGVSCDLFVDLGTFNRRLEEVLAELGRVSQRIEVFRKRLEAFWGRPGGVLEHFWKCLVRSRTCLAGVSRPSGCFL